MKNYLLAIIGCLFILSCEKSKENSEKGTKALVDECYCSKYTSVFANSNYYGISSKIDKERSFTSYENNILEIAKYLSYISDKLKIQSGGYKEDGQLMFPCKGGDFALNLFKKENVNDTLKQKLSLLKTLATTEEEKKDAIMVETAFSRFFCVESNEDCYYNEDYLSNVVYSSLASELILLQNDLILFLVEEK